MDEDWLRHMQNQGGQMRRDETFLYHMYEYVEDMRWLYCSNSRKTSCSGAGGSATPDASPHIPSRLMRPLSKPQAVKMIVHYFTASVSKRASTSLESCRSSSGIRQVMQYNLDQPVVRTALTVLT